MFSIIGWVVCGYIAGSVALWFMPPAKPAPGWQTVGFGVGGSIVGGMASALLTGDCYSPAGIMWSIIGAVVVVAGWRWYSEAE